MVFNIEDFKGIFLKMASVLTCLYNNVKAIHSCVINI